MMNTRSNKKRSTSSRGGRGKGVERQLSVEGVYANHRFMQTVGTLVGLPVQVLTKTKEVFEGVLTTFGPNFDLVLDLPHVVSTGEASLLTNPESIKRKMIFAAQDIVVIKVNNVDPEYAARAESFPVDNVISKFNGQIQSEKELEPWHGEETTYPDLGLEENANGWDADDMFKKNEEKYGVTTTYSPEMEGYTTPLQKKNTKEWKEQEAKAQQIAHEIEHSPLTQTRAEVENGEDEEEKFSAVIRPDQSSSGGGPPRESTCPPAPENPGRRPREATPSRQPFPPERWLGPPLPSGGRYNSHGGHPAMPSSYSPQSSSNPSSASGPPSGPPYPPPPQTQIKHHPQHKHSTPPSGGGARPAPASRGPQTERRLFF